MEILETFRHYLIEQDRSYLTIKGYLSDIGQFIRWFEQTNGEPFSLANVTPTDIREYRSFLQIVKQRKANTVNRHLASLATFFNWALDSNQIERNPTDKVTSIGKVENGPHYLDKKQQYALQRAIEKDIQIAKIRYPKRWVVRCRDGALTIFLQNTGLRLNEALALRMSDVQLSARSGQVLVRCGKHHKERKVPLNANARQALQEWLAVHPEKSPNYLWIPVEKPTNNPMSGRSAERILQRIGEDAGLDHLTPHMLRHTFAKNLINSGVSLEKVAELLGHDSLNTTRIYIKPSPQDLEKAVEDIVD